MTKSRQIFELYID